MGVESRVSLREIIRPFLHGLMAVASGVGG